MNASETVPEMLREAAATYEARNALYGDNYKTFGRIMTALLPDGVSLASAADHSRFALFVQVVAKLSRYAANYDRGGHDDSLLDLSVYAQMLRELDKMPRGQRGDLP